MGKTTGVLRIVSIIINVLLCVLLALAMLEAGVGGVYLILMALVIIAGALNASILSFRKRGLSNTGGTVLICLAVVLNLCSLFGVMTGLFQYGLPEAPVAAIAVIAWLIFPLITLPTLFMVRSQMKKGVKVGVVVCPNCGTEIER